MDILVYFGLPVLISFLVQLLIGCRTKRKVLQHSRKFCLCKRDCKRIARYISIFKTHPFCCCWRPGIIWGYYGCITYHYARLGIFARRYASLTLFLKFWLCSEFGCSAGTTQWQQFYKGEEETKWAIKFSSKTQTIKKALSPAALLTQFDDRLWLRVIDTMTIHRDGRITFEF